MWVKLDDRFDDNRKVKRAFRREPTSIAVYVTSLTYCARHGTDGVVDLCWLEERMPDAEWRARTLAALVDAGLYEPLVTGETRAVVVEDRTRHAGAHTVTLGPLPEDAYVVHDFLEFNPSSVEAQAKRDADAERKRQARSGASPKRPRGRRKDAARTPQAVHLASNAPDPTLDPARTRPQDREKENAHAHNDQPRPRLLKGMQ